MSGVQDLFPDDIPEPLDPPDCKVQCQFCYYTASESEFRKEHKRCWPAIRFISLLVGALAAFFVIALMAKGGVLC